MIAVIQARMSSNRLPGKVLKVVGKKPLLLHTLERVKSVAGIEKVIVATSQEQSDDVVAEFCFNNHVEVFRGPLCNVAMRFHDLICEKKIKTLVRICGDSPLVHPSVIKRAIGLYNAGSALIVSNIYPKTYPKGQSVEVFDGEHFVSCFANFHGNMEFEHVTPGLYRLTDPKRIRNFCLNFDISDIQLSVDTANDFEFVMSLGENDFEVNRSFLDMVVQRAKFDNRAFTNEFYSFLRNHDKY
jgi:spore coat polysaccharide biosynthesis protein SpsF